MADTGFSHTGSQGAGNTFANSVLARLPYSYKVLDTVAQNNPKFEHFAKLAPKRDERSIKQSVLYSQPVDVDGQHAGYVHADKAFQEYMYASLDSDKPRRISDYRRMSSFAELADAIDEICDECIVKDEDDKIMSFQVRGEFEKEVRKEIVEEWEKFITVFDLETKGWEFFRQFLIDGELYFENVISANRPDLGIIDIIAIPTEIIDPVYDNIQNGIVKGYVVRKPIVNPKGPTQQEQLLYFNGGQVTYINSSIWNPSRNVRLPYIENSRRAYKQLSLIEDSIVIYRLVRAPERLVFKVDVGNMSAPKAENYLRRLMQNYWTRKSFDNQNAGMTNIYDAHSMLDSYWFAHRDGKGTTVETLPGGHNLGQLDDLMYFVKKLYKSLKVPISRLDPADGFKDGTEITREELRFARFVMRIQKEFATGLKNSFVVHLKLRGLWKQYKLKESNICVNFNTPTQFMIMREQQIFELKFNNYNNMSTNEGIANSYAQRYYLNLSDDLMAENREWLRKDAQLMWEIENIRANGPNFREQQAALDAAAAELGGEGGAGGGFTPDLPPEFGPGPEGEEGETPPPGPEGEIPQGQTAPPADTGSALPGSSPS